MLNIATQSPASATHGAYKAPDLMVSVIMNCHNAAATVCESIDSVLAQTYAYWEIIFFDSASDDASFIIAQNYAAKDNRIRCIGHGQRIPLGQARNEALAHAQGAYIAFLDCDDIWHPQKLWLQVAHMQAHPHLDVLCTDTENFCHSQTLGLFFRTATPQKGAIFTALIQGQWIAFSSVMLRHSALRHLAHSENLLPSSRGIIAYFDPRFMLCSDADLLYRLTYLAENTITAQQSTAIQQRSGLQERTRLQRPNMEQKKTPRGQGDFLAQVLTRRRIHAHNISQSHMALWPRETRALLAKFRQHIPQFDTRYAQVVCTLVQRAIFQEALHLWYQGQGGKARKLLRRHGSSFSLKNSLFYFFSFFPPTVYPWALRCYLRMAALFRE